MELNPMLNLPYVMIPLMKREDFKHAIALTGGIATGKSTVCQLLHSRGFEIIDADKVAHNMLDLNTHAIASMFGEEYISDGKVDRAKLAKIIFNNKENRVKLETFLHPLIRDEIVAESRVYEGKGMPYIVDIPLFFESGKYDIKNVVLVYAPRELQLARMIKRDNLTKEEAIDRLNAQMPIDDKKALSRYIINNIADEAYLEDEVEKFIKDIDADLKI